VVRGGAAGGTELRLCGWSLEKERKIRISL